MDWTSTRARGVLFAFLFGWAVWPHQAEAEDPCPKDAARLERSGKQAAEFLIARNGSISRRYIPGTEGVLEVVGRRDEQYWLKIERVPEVKGSTNLWCTKVQAGALVKLPEDVKVPGFLRVSVFGKFDPEDDKANWEELKKRKLGKTEVEEQVEKWRLHTLRQIQENKNDSTLSYSHADLVEHKPASDKADKLKADIEAAFTQEGDMVAPCQASKQTVETQGICKALDQVRQQVLMGSSDGIRDTGYKAVFVGLPSATEKEAFCKKAYEVRALERPGELEYAFLSSNELPLTDIWETHEVVLGQPEVTTDDSLVGTPVVTWLRGVPTDQKPKVVWAVDESSKSDELTRMAQFVETVVALAVSQAKSPEPHVAANLQAKSQSPRWLWDFLMAAPPPLTLPELKTNDDLLERYGLRSYCGTEQKFQLPLMASKVSLVHVAEPLRGYKTYRLSACANEGCAEKDPDKKLRAQATVHTRAEGWRMTLSLGFIYNGSMGKGDVPFESWRWRPVGSSTGPEQLYQYSRAADPLSHASASLMLTFLSPSYLGPGQLGLAVGPSLLIGAELRPLRQWNLNGVWALRQGFMFTAGVGVRIEDAPLDSTREGELQLVDRASGKAPPDIDQRRVPTFVGSVGFALDLAFLADGGSALLKQMGVGK